MGFAMTKTHIPFERGSNGIQIDHLHPTTVVGGTIHQSLKEICWEYKYEFGFSYFAN